MDYPIVSRSIPLKKERGGSIVKTVVLFDDSIVRASTITFNVNECRKRGAKKIIVLIGCRPIRHPCHEGIDMKTYPDLIAAEYNNDVEAIRRRIGADELYYLSWDCLKTALGDENDLCNDLCFACLDGKHPI